MQRRDFLKTISTATAAAVLGNAASQTVRASSQSPSSFLLSSQGCGRATAYAEANKIITVDGKTHVSWLDSIDGAFRVRIRTLDQTAGSWSETYTVGEAYDNHGGPALTVDSRGFLHVIYYPHHHPFRHRRSVRPNDASEWQDEERFGTKCTYPTLMCGEDDTLYLTCRESATNPWVVNLYTKPPGKPWQGPLAIMRAERKGYAHFQEALAWGPDHRTMHLSCRIYDGGQPRVVGYLRSTDLGRSWQRYDGTPVKLPATADSVSVIADAREEPGLRCGSIAVDADGKPHVLYGAGSVPDSGASIASPDSPKAWRKQPLADAASGLMPGGGLMLPGCLSIGADGRRYAAMSMMNPPPESETWGHPTNEIVLVESTGSGGQVRARLVTDPDPTRSRWLPNLERFTGHNRVTAPGLIYTSGTAGENNKQILSNDVHWLNTASG